MIRLEYYICMTQNTILATKGRLGPVRADHRDLDIPVAGARRDADAASRREIVALKLMSTMVAVHKLEAHGVFATTASLEQSRELIDRLS